MHKSFLKLDYFAVAVAVTVLSIVEGHSIDALLLFGDNRFGLILPETFYCELFLVLNAVEYGGLAARGCP